MTIIKLVIRRVKRPAITYGNPYSVVKPYENQSLLHFKDRNTTLTVQKKTHYVTLRHIKLLMLNKITKQKYTTA